MTGAGRNKGRGRGAKKAPDITSYDGPVEETRGTPSASSGRGRAPSNAPTGPRDSSRSRGVMSPTRSNPGSREASLVQAQKNEPNTNVVLSRNVEFGGNAYNIFDPMPTNLMLRARFGKLGKPIGLNVNSHIVQDFPTKDVFQYDINIGHPEEKRGLLRKVAESQTFKQAVGRGFIFDGNKIGWSFTNFQKPLSFLVDLDAEEGRPSREVNKKRVRIVKAKNEKVRLHAIKAYLEGSSDFSTTVVEAINFLDHLLRETPAHTHINLRRSYFHRHPKEDDVFAVGRGVEAIKGVYQSIRLAEGAKLVVNVDVANSCFWTQTNLVQIAFQMSGETNLQSFEQDMIRKPASTKGNVEGEVAMSRMLKRLHKNRFYVKHGPQGDASARKEHVIKLINTRTNAKEYKLTVKNREQGTEDRVSLFDYFKKKYGITLQNWRFPLVETTKAGTVFPMELCFMCSGQRYPYKLNEDQTSKMIKFAATRPENRKRAIESGLAMLNWQQDPVLNAYGLKINNQMLTTRARVLDPPEVQYANGVAQPGYSGRWDLRGKVFAKSNPAPLKSWGVCILGPGQDRRAPLGKAQVDNFIKQYVAIYKKHGGRVENESPIVVTGVPDVATAIQTTYNNAGNAAKADPQMLIVILPNKSADVYHRVKKNCELRYGVVSQCMQASNVAKGQDQYISNVLMKFNCKLGGTTCTVKTKTPLINKPTMIIGADVSHPAPGASALSLAAVSVSMDKPAARYLAAVESNGFRVEMITPTNIHGMLAPLIQHWMSTVSNGKLPEHVIYFRDGVSEGQYRDLLKNEVADIKKVFDNIARGLPLPKFTVVVAEKRHHIRFFPTRGPASDRNGNPVPGVLVDKDVTHPFENDIYLCSHAAIQGTARPTHYQILLDEANMDVDHFQTLLYSHCYQYQRATTPVSLFPAVYYAHLAAARGVGRIDQEKTDEWLKKVEEEEAQKNSGTKSQGSKSTTEAPKLIPIQTSKRPNGTKFDMWYI